MRSLGRTALWLSLGLIGAAVFACGSGVTELTVALDQQDGSGQAGTATLKSLNPGTEVTLEVSPADPDDDPQPVHIHFGTCGPNLGRVEHSLDDVVAGRSTTVVESDLAKLIDGGYTINLHKSYSEISVYTACGNIGPG